MFDIRFTEKGKEQLLNMINNGIDTNWPGYHFEYEYILGDTYFISTSYLFNEIPDIYDDLRKLSCSEEITLFTRGAGTYFLRVYVQGSKIEGIGIRGHLIEGEEYKKSISIDIDEFILIIRNFFDGFLDYCSKVKSENSYFHRLIEETRNRHDEN